MSRNDYVNAVDIFDKNPVQQRSKKIRLALEKFHELMASLSVPGRSVEEGADHRDIIELLKALFREEFTIPLEFEVCAAADATGINYSYGYYVRPRNPKAENVETYCVGALPSVSGEKVSLTILVWKFQPVSMADYIDWYNEAEEAIR